MNNSITFDFIAWTSSNLELYTYLFLQAIYEENYIFAKLLLKWDIPVAKLQLDGYIKITGDDVEDIKIREEGIALFEITDVNSLAEKMRNLFPIGVKTGGIPVRSNLKEISAKLKKFTKEYKYTEEQILKATERYVVEKRAVSWEFMKTVSYFILKDKTSVLADYCEQLNEIPEQEVSKYKEI